MRHFEIPAMAMPRELLLKALDDPETSAKIDAAKSMREFEDAILAYARKHKIRIINMAIP